MMLHRWKIIFCLILSACCSLLCNVVLADSNPEGIEVYQKNLHLSAEHRQVIADDIDRYRNADNLWDVLREQFGLQHYEDNPMVQQKIMWYMEHQDFLIRSATRSAPYLYYIFQQVKKRHLPAELVLLPIIESAYNPFALNVSSGAAGIWQMMPNTASGYGIRQNGWYDGRKDVIASTKAALTHLAYLESFFQGNWLLAIAAYDTGEGNVLSAIRRNINNGEITDFWHLPLAQETRDYVPQLLALAIIVSHPERYPINFPPIQNAPYLAQIDMNRQISLERAAELAGLRLKELMQLNSGYSHKTIDTHGPLKLVLPIENVEQFSENITNTPFSSQDILVPTEEIAPTRFARNKSILLSKNMTQKYKNRNKNSRNFNNDSNDSNNNDDSNIMMLKNSQENQTEEQIDEFAALTDALQQTQTHYTMKPGDTLYMVREKDTLDKIARRFHVSRQTLASINGLKSITAGQQLIIPTHATTQKYQLTPGDTVYMVRRGDTIERIAKKFHITPEEVRLANLLASNTLQNGDRLVIPTHVEMR